MKKPIVFIGGPLDLTRMEIDAGTVPPYWRVATSPKIGALYSKPDRPNVIPASQSFDYQIVPLREGRGGRQVYVGLPLELS